MWFAEVFTANSRQRSVVGENIKRADHAEAIPDSGSALFDENLQGECEG
jgi:hypothetical protein